MKRKPKKGEALLLLCRCKASSRGFQLWVHCVDALDRDDDIMRTKMRAEKVPVTVRLQDGSILEVTRGDLEPVAEAPVVPTAAVPIHAGRVVLEALEKEPETRLKNWRDAPSSFHKVCARYELGRRAVKGSG